MLDAIADEGLQDNAARVGAALKRSLTALADEHELIGAVHGRGLYRGVDLVVDRDTREPAVAQARWICERMRELGVVVQPTGDHGNVLKVKPPLCITEVRRRTVRRRARPGAARAGDDRRLSRCARTTRR